MAKIVEELPYLTFPTRGSILDTFKEDEDREFLGKDSSYTYYLKCNICAKDPLLYKEGYFKTKLRGLKSGKFCGCGTDSFSNTPQWHVKEVVKRKCKEKGYKFLGFVGEYKNPDTKLKLGCSEGHYWDSTSISKFLRCGRGCPHCAGNVAWTKERFLEEADRVHNGLYTYGNLEEIKNSKSQLSVFCKEHGEFFIDIHHHINRGQGCGHVECRGSKISEARCDTTETFVKKAKAVHGDTYDYTDTTYHRTYTPLSIFCYKCDEDFSQLPSDHLSGCGCPSCAGRNQKQSYIFTVLDQGEAIAFKFGIANHYNSRYVRQRGKTMYDLEVYGVWGYKDTVSCKLAESTVKGYPECRFLTQEEYPDGYSETLPLHLLDNVIAEYESKGGKRLL